MASLSTNIGTGPQFIEETDRVTGSWQVNPVRLSVIDTVKVEVAASLAGVPVTVPSELSVNPSGRLPDAKANVGIRKSRRGQRTAVICSWSGIRKSIGYSSNRHRVKLLDVTTVKPRHPNRKRIHTGRRRRAAECPRCSTQRT